MHASSMCQTEIDYISAHNKSIKEPHPLLVLCTATFQYSKRYSPTYTDRFYIQRERAIKFIIYTP